MMVLLYTLKENLTCNQAFLYFFVCRQTSNSGHCWQRWPEWIAHCGRALRFATLPARFHRGKRTQSIVIPAWKVKWTRWVIHFMNDYYLNIWFYVFIAVQYSYTCLLQHRQGLDLSPLMRAVFLSAPPPQSHIRNEVPAYFLQNHFTTTSSLK